MDTPYEERQACWGRQGVKNTSDLEIFFRQNFSEVRPNERLIEPRRSLATCVKHSVLSSKLEHSLRARGESVGQGW